MGCVPITENALMINRVTVKLFRSLIDQKDVFDWDMTSRNINPQRSSLQPMKILPGFLLFLVLNSCTNPKPYPVPFDFDHPVEITKLPESLHEISGIAFFRKNELVCVQDEKGVIYFYNIKKDKLRNSIPFAKDKDYEAICNVNDTLFVLCSNGEISEINISDDENIVHSYKTFLSKQNNCEGLCYDKKFNRLLVACKGKPEKKTAAKYMKAIYAFDLERKKLLEKPAFVIDPDDVKAHLLNEEQVDLENRESQKQKAIGPFSFEPSEIGIDPLTNDVYVLSSVGKIILSMSYQGTIKFAYHLDPHTFKQPEGIAFAEDGSMFISDEGRGGRANLIRVERNR